MVFLLGVSASQNGVKVFTLRSRRWINTNGKNRNIYHGFEKKTSVHYNVYDKRQLQKRLFELN